MLKEDITHTELQEVSFRALHDTMAHPRAHGWSISRGGKQSGRKVVDHYSGPYVTKIYSR